MTIVEKRNSTTIAVKVGEVEYTVLINPLGHVAGRPHAIPGGTLYTLMGPASLLGGSFSEYQGRPNFALAGGWDESSQENETLVRMIESRFKVTLAAAREIAQEAMKFVDDPVESE